MPFDAARALSRRAALKFAGAVAVVAGGLAKAALPAFAGDPTGADAQGNSPASLDIAKAPAVEIAPQVYAHQGHYALYAPNNEGDISNASFIVGRDAVAVIDTGGSALVGAHLRDTIRGITPLPVRYVINTHMHPDHVFGNASFEADKPAFVAHHKLARGLSARAERYLAINKELLGEAAFAGTKIVLPTQPISEPTTLDLGGRALLLSPQRTAHTDNDLVIRDIQTGSVFLGDLLFSKHVPTLDGSILGWIAVMEALSREPAERVIPGHGPPSMSWPDAGKPLLRYLEVVRDEIRVLIKDNRTITDAVASVGLSEKSAWMLFDDYHARNVSAAFAELEWE